MSPAASITTGSESVNEPEPGNASGRESATETPSSTSMPSSSSRLDQPCSADAARPAVDRLTPAPRGAVSGGHAAARPSGRPGPSTKARTSCSASRCSSARSSCWRGSRSDGESGACSVGGEGRLEVRQGVHDDGDGRHPSTAQRRQRRHPRAVERWRDGQRRGALPQPHRALHQHLRERRRALGLGDRQEAQDLVLLARTTVGGDDRSTQADGLHAHATVVGEGVGRECCGRIHRRLDGGVLGRCRRGPRGRGRRRSRGPPRARCRTP